ncbi:MAG: hypothetical protein RL364_1121, partial [Pseudomonadota bacterium]
ASIATGDFVAGFAGQGGEATHEGAANAKNVNMHARILGGRSVPKRPLRAQ